MSTAYDSQKRSEIRILETARRACSLFPPGDIVPFEEPDLKIMSSAGQIGVEETELVSAKGTSRFLPVQDENFHREIIRSAEEHYLYPADGERAARATKQAARQWLHSSPLPSRSRTATV